jgi:hypothetical protein
MQSFVGRRIAWCLGGNRRPESRPPLRDRAHKLPLLQVQVIAKLGPRLRK